jgi:hypothetical protein
MSVARQSQTTNDKDTQDTLLIRKSKIPVIKTWIDHTKLRFYPDNPRVHSILHADEKEPPQEQIQKRLLELEHVKALIQSIKLNGGLIDPIIVRDGTFQVLEGNSRLAAYRALASSDPIKWAKIHCILLPKDISESLVFALLGEYHIKGKKDWAPYEQAGFVYRRFKVHKIDQQTLGTEIGLSQKHVKHLIETYQFMRTHSQEDITRWSFFDEYLKSRKIGKAREQYSCFDKLVVDKINSGEIPKAVDVRDRLPIICAAPRALKKFCEEKYDFEEACEHAIAGGGSNAAYKRLEKFRQWLAHNEVQEGILEAGSQMRQKFVYEVDKLSTLVNGLRTKLHKKD